MFRSTTALKIITSILFTNLISGCMYSGTPISSVNKDWISEKCSAVPYGTKVSCSNYSNCTTITYPDICKCTYDSGDVYVGNLSSGKSWCGVQKGSGSSSYIYINGKGTEQQVGFDLGSTALLVFGAAAAAAIIDAAADSGGGGGTTPATSDYDWDWDAFNDAYGNLQWRCRGVSSGRFADSSNCLWDTKDDDRWPGR